MKLSLRSTLMCLAACFLAGVSPAQPPARAVETVPGQPQQQPQAELERGPRHERRIALTFDAGGGDEELTGLLRALAREDIVATFFLTGQWAAEFPAGAAQILEQGHLIGNHTWGHKDLTRLTDAEITQQILLTDDRFTSLFGCSYLPLFRAPFGEVDKRVLGVVEKLGFRSVRWSIDTLDSMEPRKTAAFLADRVLARSDEELCGAIILMHVGYAETAEALPMMIHNLRERGFEFVPLSAWVPRTRPALTSRSTSSLLDSPAAMGRAAVPHLDYQTEAAALHAPGPILPILKPQP